MACVLVVKYDKIIDTDRNVKKNNGWTGLSRLLKKNFPPPPPPPPPTPRPHYTPFANYPHLLLTPIYYLPPFIIYPHLLFTPIYYLPLFTIYHHLPPLLLYPFYYFSGIKTHRKSFRRFIFSSKHSHLMSKMTGIRNSYVEIFKKFA